MPRKAKSTEKEENVLLEEKTKEIKSKKETKKKASEDNKKKVEKKAVTKSKIKKEEKKDVDTKKKVTAKTTSKITTQKNTKTKKTEIKAKEKKSEPKKKTTTKTATQKTTKDKKTETKKSTKTSKKVEVKKSTKKTTKSKATTKKEKKFLAEYYDLPYRYNETVVKILAQTPKKLFIYWDISDKDIKKYKKVFGENFFYDTYPVLLIHNEEMDYTFEVQVNDFANCWYVDINDAKCKYSVNLGRKFKNINKLNIDENQLKQENIDLKNDYLQITISNTLEVPNDKILFDKLGNTVKYRNVKTFEETNKNIENIISENGNILKIYDIYEFYKQIYKNEIDENIFDINNPSSGNTYSKILFK